MSSRSLWHRVFEALTWYGDDPDRFTMTNCIIYDCRRLCELSTMDDGDLEDFLLDYPVVDYTK